MSRNRAAFITARVSALKADGISRAMAEHFARVEWDRRKAGKPLSVKLPSIAAIAPPNNRFTEKSGEKQGPRRRRFLKFLRELPLAKQAKAATA